jgi:RNA polymerase sigma-70 factor, ECF subfamily
LPEPDITALLVRWGKGDEAALDQLVPLVHRELRQIARRCMAGERAGHTFQATELVNEAYMRLIEAANIDWQDRAHFLAVAARVMRRILVDHARTRHSQKRGGNAVGISLDDALIVAREPRHDFEALDDALAALARVDDRKSRVVELRFFGGLTVDETASVLQVGPDTVMRDWRLAKAWLQREMLGDRVDGS